MKTLKCILFSAMCCLCSVGASAQSLGDILGSLGEGLTVSAVLKNPNMQSADMKNFFAFINAGHMVSQRRMAELQHEAERS